MALSQGGGLMLKECIDIFEYNLNEKGEALILDWYVPKNGRYILIQNSDYSIKDIVDIKNDRKKDIIEGKENEYFRDICYMDYYSSLLDMNKPIDPKKTIHSNNYLSFFFKKEKLIEEKISDEIIDKYYEILANPLLKYKDTKNKKIYKEIEEELGEVNIAQLEKNKKWIVENLNKLDIGEDNKDYCKIFFVDEDIEKTKKDYNREGTRYIIPNIYNKNDFNIELEEKIYGLPNDNMGMNSKKPYLDNKTRLNSKLPYMLNKEEVLLQKKFFDYLMCQVSYGNYNIYFNVEEKEIIPRKSNGMPNDDEEDNLSSFNGYFISLKKGKNEVEIREFDYVISYNPNLKDTFEYIRFVKVNKEEEKGVKEYITKKNKLESIIDDIFFSKYLKTNYFNEPSDISIKDGTILFNLLRYKERFKAYFKFNDSIKIDKAIDAISNEVIRNSLSKGYLPKAKKQFNLRLSFKRYYNKEDKTEEKMENILKKIEISFKNKEKLELENDEEFYFVIGQLVYYFCSKSKAKNLQMQVVNTFLKSKSLEKIKEKLNKLFTKYNHDINFNDHRIKNLYSEVLLYKVKDEEVVSDMLLAGFLSENVFYKSYKED